MKKKSKIVNFESALEELETLVNTLEEGNLSLEESLTAFERGIKLTRECQQHLSEAEQKVSLLVNQDDDLALIDFNASNTNA